jgi:hypothetical protein
MVFEYTSCKETKYYLHQKGHSFFFSKNPEGALDNLPTGFKIKENPKTGMPILKKIQGAVI